MSTYEIYLLLGSLLGVMAFLSFASVVLDRGSVRIFAFFLALSLGALYMAKENSDYGVDFHDLPPAINKLIGPWLRGDGG